MHVKLTKDRAHKGAKAGDVVEVAGYEGRRLIEQSAADPAEAPAEAPADAPKTGRSKDQAPQA